ncbi:MULTISPECIES: pyridoxamine 5'-phosphate oxidase [Vibrio]|jgi:pyridoxamine 5'-phosphate oxidase|uniref:Pyridoxine/pyridoxamine 5'-phosphate oxidase n=1 Tax=Vibrio chagasii TaxID=170679 RepID=A0A2S7VRL2_9VIBR|nr:MULTISPECIES: pyridoxamine 5'-phosphate oxidase [Vibrio]EGU45801.1 pyridoxamine 5'-phosphate oxidase [Vibrio splendidus ATCC 33789]KZX59799.1 pyridoxamine 5'-phosphate oxidase [Vibrio sp. HI00D65]MCG9690397.1 pyridoxamine 5'-phosphate oxidase [Vibrio sp. Isolate22]NOH36559.1 pyridoxamine 5'-phosphate oxidase [Vibrio chagasii]PQJ64485.1 pyridoxamine 5'-phosphate oxidase [Vibrio chagasii]|tara:strand:- start:24 stop:659 length:636 start_codon:yes stop_codon:yes gene_type:complete
MELTDIRREYAQGGLRRKDLAADPIDQFNLWLEQAIEAKLTDPTAMTVATVDENGQPFQRIVLLKNVDKDGFVFYTNLGSRKAQQLEHNSKISLHFPWHPLERQVHITGTAEKLTAMENMKYFSSRPKESQLAAIASKQSSRISARGILEGKYLELKQKFAKGEIPVPSFWGGFRVRVDSIEFWQGGEHRLHDRFLFSRQDNSWDIDRLAP